MRNVSEIASDTITQSCKFPVNSDQASNLKPKFHIPSFSYVTAGPNEWRCIIRKKGIFYFLFEAQVEPNHPQISNKKFAERHSAGKVIFAS